MLGISILYLLSLLWLVSHYFFKYQEEKFKSSLNFYLLVKHQHQTLKKFTTQINRANFYIQNASNLKMIAQFFPSLSGVKNASELIIRQMKYYQNLKLISFQKNQLIWQQKKWANGNCFYRTPYLTENKIQFVRDRNQSVQIKEQQWPCIYHQDKMLIQIKYQLANASQARLQSRFQVKDLLF